MKPMNKIKRKKMHGRIYLKYCSKITIFLQNKTHLYKIKLKKKSLQKLITKKTSSTKGMQNLWSK